MVLVQDTVIEEDKDFVTQYFDMPDTDFADMERMSPWLLRIELNREMLTDKGLNMSRIADTITSEFGDEMSVIFTDDNAPKHILRVGLHCADAAISDPYQVLTDGMSHCQASVYAVVHLCPCYCMQGCCSTASLPCSQPRHCLCFGIGLPNVVKTCLSCIFSILCINVQIRMLGEEGGKDASGMQEHGDDVFLKKIESHLLTQVYWPSTHMTEMLHM